MMLPPPCFPVGDDTGHDILYLSNGFIDRIFITEVKQFTLDLISPENVVPHSPRVLQTGFNCFAFSTLP